MAELKAGVIGCAICIFALMGSIFGASLMTADNVDTPITTYEYITDVTGAFDTTQAPEYISYNPAANYVGYSIGTMNYTASTTPNAYRYVVSYPQDQTINRTVTATTSIEGGSTLPFTPSFFSTRMLMNYTGTGYNFGTSVTSDGLTYNAYANTGTMQYSNTLLITKLHDVIYTTFSSHPDGSGNVEINITNNGSYPLILMDRTSYTHRTISDGDTNVWNIYHANVTDTTKIVWNVNTDIATIYNGSTVLFSGNASTDVDVAYRYSYDAGGTPTIAGINTVLSHTYNSAVTTTVTSNSSYPNYNPQNTHDLYINNVAMMGSLPTTPGGTQNGYGYNMYLQYNNSNRGITTLTNILSELNIPPNTAVFINIANNSDPAIFCYSTFTDIGATADWVETSSANFPYRIAYASDGNVTIYYHPAGDNQSRVAYAGPPNNVYVVYRYYYSGHDASVSTSLSTSYTLTEDMTITDSSTISVSSLSPFDASTGGTMAIMDWDGLYDMGIGSTYNGISYKIKANNTTILGTGSVPDIWTLDGVLERWNLDDYTVIDLNIDGNENYPVFFYYGGWTTTPITYGGQTQYVYSATLNEDNSMPDRISIANGTARAFRNGTLIYTATTDNIYVANKYQIDTGSGFANTTVYAHLTGYATKDSEAISITVSNSSSYPSDAYGFANPNGSWAEIRYLLPYLNYTGTQYNNLGTTFSITSINKNAKMCLTSHESNNFTTYNTKLTNILDAIGMSNYDSIDVSLTYGTHPVIFLKGNWEFYNRDLSYHDQGGTVHYYYNYYWNTIDDNAFPDHMTYNKATELATFYKNGQQIWSATASQVQVIYKYWILTPSGIDGIPTYTAITNQSVTMTGTARLHPAYGYANPEFGVTLKTNGMTTWKNGYENDVINILWYSTDSTHQNDLTITADTSTITVTRATNGQVTVDIMRADNTTETRNMGTWDKGQITIDVTNHTVSFTPITGSERPNFTDAPVELNPTTYTWTDWYIGNPIEQLTISTTGYSLNFGVTGTSVFLDTYGVVMFDPTLDITDYFPELTEWRLNFFSFALVGDSVTINNVVYPINKADNTITVVDTDNHSLTGTLNNVYLTKENTHGSSDPHYFFTFANTNKTVDLGAVETDTVSFQGMWYFTTGLYELGEGTAKIWSWVPSINIDLNLIALFYIGMMAAALVIGKGILHADIGGLDWVILISTSFIALIVAGGVI